ncbi:MAG: hypothetical protein M1826_006571 [Phylliscum demangeonii]|nr:MAG: hypothetical protein M1826_006571 [Phylliscum demangeonii]
MIDPAAPYLQHLCSHEGDQVFVKLMDQMETDGIPKSQWFEHVKSFLDPQQQLRFNSWLVGHKESNAARPDKVRQRILTLQADSYDHLKRLASYFMKNRSSVVEEGWGLAMGHYGEHKFVLRPRAFLDVLVSGRSFDSSASGYGSTLPGPLLKGDAIRKGSGSSDGSSHSSYASRSSGPLMENTHHNAAGREMEAEQQRLPSLALTISTSPLVCRLPQPFFCLGELMRVDLSGEEMYTGFIVALRLVDQSVWVVFNSRDCDTRWSSAHESQEYWNDDRDDVPDYLPDLDPAWAELAIPGKKWAAAKVADGLRSWVLGDPFTQLSFSQPLSLASGVVPELQQSLYTLIDPSNALRDVCCSPGVLMDMDRKVLSSSVAAAARSLSVRPESSTPSLFEERVLVERLRVAEAEAAQSKKRTHAAAVLLGQEKNTAADLRKRVAGLEQELASVDFGREAPVDDCRAAKAGVLRIKGVLEQATVALRSPPLQIDGHQARTAKLEKEFETRSKVTVRDYNRLVDDRLLLKEKLRLLWEEMEKLHLSIAARSAEQAVLANVRSRFAEQTRVVQHQIDSLQACDPESRGPPHSPQEDAPKPLGCQKIAIPTGRTSCQWV